MQNGTDHMAANTLMTPFPTREPDESNYRYLERMMEGLPAPEGDRGDELTGKILGSGSLQEDNDVWDSTSTRDLIGRTFVFHDVKVRTSDYTEGLRYMLVCDVSDPKTGEKDVITTGAVNVCASLVAAKYRGDLPAEAEIRGPKRKLDDGKTPIHLHWLGKSVS